MQMADDGMSGISTNERALPRDVKAAINYMRRNIGKQLLINDLLVATGARERTLRKHFLRFLGQSPLTFFLRLRLAAARDALLTPSADSVSEVAAQFGFVHFGRFASDYRRCFGELPSATRRRVLQVVPPPPRTIPMPYLSAIVPTLVITPIQTQGDRESNFLAEGLRDVLSVELARGQGLSVRLAPSGYGLPARRLGGRYCLAGRVTRVTGRVRVTMRLVDIEEERHVWGDSFDGPAHDMLTLQDLVAANVLNEVRPRILGDVIGRAQRADLSILAGSDITMRALPFALLPNRTEQALALLGRATSLAPDCALAVGLAGWCHAKRATPWNTEAAQERVRASQMADRAGILAPADPMVLAIRASIAHLEREYEAAESLAARSVAIDPTCAWGWDRLGWVHEATNRLDEAMPFFARVERIPAPYLDGAERLNGVATAYIAIGRYKEAVPVLRKALQVRPDSSDLRGKLATCYVGIGDKVSGRVELEKLRRLLPGVSAQQYVNSYPCAFDSFRNAMANSLTEIGMSA
jgi:TolB-like protein/AraC-like DNA-binding protein